MPVSWQLELAMQPKRPLRRRFDVLHAIACRFFEGPGVHHEAGEKCFAIRLDRPQDDRLLRLTWLNDHVSPAVEIPEKLQVGEEMIPIASVQQSELSFTAIESVRLQTSWRLRVETPALFRHHGLNYLLPDPQVMFAGLSRRHRSLSPDTSPDDDLVRQLGRLVAVVRHELRTERFSWHGRTDAGFVGVVELGLSRAASAEATRAFTTLGSFAGVAGLGRGTTHGLGAVTMTPGDR